MGLFRSFGAACSHIQRTFLGNFGTNHYTRRFNNLNVLYKCQQILQSICRVEKSEIPEKVFIIGTHATFYVFERVLKREN